MCTYSATCDVSGSLELLFLGMKKKKSGICEVNKFRFALNKKKEKEED
jgi:hypothetical protein